jgi:membrane protease YdiL (CAAX protease family)
MASKSDISIGQRFDTVTLPSYKRAGSWKSKFSRLLGIFWNPYERRLRAFWRLVGAVVLMILLTNLILGLLSVLGIANPTPVTGQIIFNSLAVAAVLIATRLLDRRKISDIGLGFNNRWFRDLGFGLLLGAALWTALFLFELAAGWITIEEFFRDANDGRPFLVSLLPAVILYISVGIFEELAFRGYLLRNVAEGFNFGFIGKRGAIILSWLLTALLFGALHGSNTNTGVIEVLNIALAGIWLGLGYILTGSLMMPIGAHITFNFFAGHVFGFQVAGMVQNATTLIAIKQSGPEAWTGGAYGPGGGLLGPAMLALGILLLVAWARARHGKLRIFTTLVNPRNQ